MTDLITLPAVIDKVETRKDRTVKLTVSSMTELPPDESAVLFSLNQQAGFLGFSERPLTQEDFIDLGDMPNPTKKPQSALSELRAVLHVWGTKLGKEDVDNFVDYQLRRIKGQILDKIKELDEE